MRKKGKNFFIGFSAVVIFIAISSFVLLAFCLSKDKLPSKNEQHFKEIQYPTPNFNPEKKNEILGVILHHTAEPTIEKALRILSSPEKNVSTHVVIDTDGTRYVMADPSVVTYHAGYSVLNGRDSCNLFTIGIEFQGNTLVSPLTEEQIASGIEYLLPLIEEYKIPLNNIVTHQMVRNAYKQKYPEKRCSGKIDITQSEYQRFTNVLRKTIGESLN